MSAYRKRPVEVEAQQWDGTVHGATPLIDWMLNSGATARYHEAEIEESFTGVGQINWPARIAIDTLEGRMWATASDWIIRGVKGEFYPCKPDIFEATYEPVSP